MTLDEAIRHCEEVVTKYEKQAANSMSKEGKEYNCECANDHRQLAEWLTELKKAKSMLLDYSYTVDIMCNKVSGMIGCEKCTYYNPEIHDCEVRTYITKTRAFVKENEAPALIGEEGGNNAQNTFQRSDET